MSLPTQTCQLCGMVEVVRQDGRGFPPDIAKRRLKRRCNESGCTSQPTYLVGMSLRPAVGAQSGAILASVPTEEPE